MANITERNWLVLLLLVSCQPSLNAYIFSFLFFLQFEFVLLCFCFVLFCFFSFNFPSWYQFNFVSFSCWKFNFTYFFHNYDNYSMLRDVPECSGMFRDVPYSMFRVPCSWFYRRPIIEMIPEIKLAIMKLLIHSWEERLTCFDCKIILKI